MCLTRCDTALSVVVRSQRPQPADGRLPQEQRHHQVRGQDPRQQAQHWRKQCALAHQGPVRRSRDDTWRALREAYNPFFLPGSLELFARSMNAASRVLLQRLGDAAASGELVDVFPMMTALTMVGRRDTHAQPPAARPGLARCRT